MRRSILTFVAAAGLCSGAPSAATVLPPVPIPSIPSAPATYLAPAAACPGQTAIGASAATQLVAMRCLVNWARRHYGLGSVRRAWRLDRAARMRAGEIRRCRQFSHTPCGEAFIRVFVAAGYLHGTGTVAENLAWGASGLGSARSALASWLASPGHRANLFAAGWRDLGVALLKANTLFGAANVSVWVVQFGRRG